MHRNPEVFRLTLKPLQGFQGDTKSKSQRVSQWKFDRGQHQIVNMTKFTFSVLQFPTSSFSLFLIKQGWYFWPFPFRLITFTFHYSFELRHIKMEEDQILPISSSKSYKKNVVLKHNAKLLTQLSGTNLSPPGALPAVNLKTHPSPVKL